MNSEDKMTAIIFVTLIICMTAAAIAESAFK